MSSELKWRRKIPKVVCLHVQKKIVILVHRDVVFGNGMGVYENDKKNKF